MEKTQTKLNSSASYCVCQGYRKINMHFAKGSGPSSSERYDTRNCGATVDVRWCTSTVQYRGDMDVSARLCLNPRRATLSLLPL